MDLQLIMNIPPGAMIFVWSIKEMERLFFVYLDLDLFVKQARLRLPCLQKEIHFGQVPMSIGGKMEKFQIWF